RVMSALPPKADIGTHSRDVCFVPKADIEPLIRSPRRAVARSDDATVMPSARAVFRLITSSNLSGFWTGMSAGLSQIYPGHLAAVCPGYCSRRPAQATPDVENMRVSVEIHLRG